MATVSPTPAPAGPVRRTSQRQALRRPPSRQALNHNQSAPAAPAPAQVNQSQQYDDDSSEDEIPVPMKLSALTKALLNDGVPAEEAHKPVQPSPPRTRRQASVLNTSTSSAVENRRHLRSGSVQATDPRGDRAPTPEKEKEISPPRKRVVRLSSTPQSLSQIGSKRRSTSSQSAQPRSSQPARPSSRTGNRDRSGEEKDIYEVEINTPGQRERVVRIASGSGSRGRVTSSGPSSGRSHPDRSAMDKSAMDVDDAGSEDPEAVYRSAPPVSIGSMANAQGSLRVKRVGKISGNFLSGPARRGRRRQSEEEEEHGDADVMMQGQEPDSQAPADPAASSFYGEGREFNSGSPVSGGAARASHRRQNSQNDLRRSLRRSLNAEQDQEPKQNDEPLVEVLPPKPALPSTHDQENEIPSSYKRSKPSVDPIMDKIPSRPISAKKVSPERKPLSTVEKNTPHRPAPPPPPKMSVLDAATANAGASTTTQKQRRNVLKVNGKCYTRLDCLGRGGSAKVYRVTAENGKMFALKRVSLEHADEVTVRGFRGEIDLLGKLANVERVISLYDYEMNDEKQALTLLMEMGELDFNTLLRSRQNPDTAKFDPVFTRFYWKEMLECLQSVHQYHVVHSDLKPANFVLVQGRLKLIDFGIANSIQTDETVNVHRETQIGTPSYMSPESLLDSNNPRGGRMPGRPKLMKIGKPSDVWSLGCILYQMVYGVPPFGHIPNPMGRCQAIVNWDYAIEFPKKAMGGTPVPPSLMRTMRRCLQRDQHMRPTCEELLHDTDPFLYPAEASDKAVPIEEELLARIIQHVVTRCKERMPTEAEIQSVWPQAYWASVRKAMAQRTHQAS